MIKFNKNLTKFNYILNKNSIDFYMLKSIYNKEIELKEDL